MGVFQRFIPALSLVRTSTLILRYDPGIQIWSGCMSLHQAPRISCPLDKNADNLSPRGLFQAFPFNSVGGRPRANFCEKTRERVANFVRSLCAAHAKLGRRAPCALCNTKDVGVAVSRASVAFGAEIAPLCAAGSYAASKKKEYFQMFSSRHDSNQSIK